MAPAQCPSHDELQGYVCGSLNQPLVEFVSQHVEQCQSCESTVVELERGADSVLASLRRRQPTEFSHEPQCREAMQQVAAMAPPKVVLTDSGSSAQHAQASSPSAAHAQMSIEDMTQRIAASGLMTVAEVQAYVGKLPPPSRPLDGQGLARELVKAGVMTKYQANVLYHGRTKGLVYGDYRILDKIGAGGMGQVLKAQHRRMKRIVALKLLTSAASRKPGAARRFEREVEAAARLEHPNIITAYDAGEHDGVLYLAMQYVDGPDLASLVKRRGPLPVRDAVGYIVQAGRGLAYAHERGVIHRDIKPSNLLIDAAGTVQVLDMGLARLTSEELAGDEGLTSTGQVMGTADYMAPEQALDTKTADARSDIYSLGCTLYWLLTGKSVYSGDTLMARLLAHREQPIPSLRAARDDVPEAVDLVFTRMLAKRPQDRCATMKQCLAELESALDTSALQERPLPPAAPPPKVPAAVEKDRAIASSSAESPSQKSPQPPARKPPITADFKRPAPRASAAVAPEVRGHDEGEVFFPAVSKPFHRPSRRGDAKSLLAKPQWLIAGAAIVLAMVGLATLALAVIVLRFRTPEGTVVVELNEPGATVLVDGNRRFTAQIDGEAEPIKFGVSSGEHVLEVSKGGFVTQTKNFKVKQGETVALSVRLEAERFPNRGKLGDAGTKTPPDGEVPPVPATEPVGRERWIPLNEQTPGTASWVWTNNARTSEQKKWIGGVLTLENRGYAFNSIQARNVSFRSQVKLIEGNNMALIVRAKRGGGGIYAMVQKLEDGTIAIALLNKVEHKLFKPKGEFFEFCVSAVGNRVTVEADGETLIEYKEQETLEAGHVALTAYDAKGIFKDIEVKILDSKVLGKTIDLLALVDPARDAVHGKWTQTPEGLVSDGTVPFCRLRFPCELPAEYDYRVEFTAGGGNDILQILSSGTTSFTLLLGGWGGRWDGFDKVRGHPFQRDGTGIVGGASRVRRGQRHSALVQVRRESVAAFIDGQQVARHPTDYTDLGIPREWEIGGGLGLGTTYDRVVFHAAELIEYNDDGREQD